MPEKADKDTSRQTVILRSLFIAVIIINSGLIISSIVKQISMNVGIIVEIVLLVLAVIGSIVLIIVSLKKKDAQKDKDSAMILIRQLQSSMDLLSQKATSLKDAYSEEKQKIASLAEDVKSFEPVRDILGAKFEQEIMGKITIVSTQCDSVIAGNDSAELKKQLSLLDSQIQQRKVMKD